MDDYLARRWKHEPYLERLRTAFEIVDKNRLSFLDMDINAESTIDDFAFVPLRRGPCQMTIESYFQPFVFCLSSVLLDSPQTSYFESVSMLMALGRSLCSATYTSIATRMLIATNPQTTDKGWWLIQQIKKIDEVNKAED